MKRSATRFFAAAATILLAAGVACSCNNSDKAVDSGPATLEVDVTTVNFTEENASNRTIMVKSNVAWDYTVSDGWLHAEKQPDRLIISAEDNDQKNIRRATVTITVPDLPAHTVEVQQLGWGKAILLSQSTTTVSAAGGDITVEVTTNVEVEAAVGPDCTWIYETPIDTRSAAHPVVTSTRAFSVSGNTADGTRSATITFSDKQTPSDVEAATLTVTQRGLDAYAPESTESLKDDIKLIIARGEASSYQSGGEIELSFDGDMNTIYHSNWNNAGDNYFPITLTYYLEQESDIDYMVYYPRTTGWNGRFKEVEIEALSAITQNASTAPAATPQWQHVMTHDFGGNASAAKVEFPEPLIGVTALRLTVKSGAGDGQGFASCAEMEFYRRNPEAFDYTTLFTDASCSELRAGVTPQDIAACPYAFFKNIAYFMYHDRYAKEFRINTFKAYPNPDTEATRNKTSQYSLLDNPTGIEVAAGQQLIVMADLKGQSVSLRVQNLDRPNGDGFGGDSYPISTGVNKIDITNKGLVYVMYHTDNFASAPDVRMHFATGTVNGYYDSQRPDHEGRAHELLDAATGKYFDVVGAYAHLIFPTERFRNHTHDLKELIDAYDALVYREQEFIGLEKYGKMFHNRMCFTVMYTSYMYSTSYHTAYHDDTLAELCDENRLTTSACWGPAHEVGHSNQTRPGLKWLGTTEVTNNILSQHIQTSVYGQDSRVQTENMGDAANPNRYTKAWSNILVKDAPHATEGDVFCKLIPFWQLELYFGKVLGRTPMQQSDHGGFYADCFEWVRTHDNLSTAGEQQLEFVYIASACARMNLLDFFDKWGFLTPVDATIDDYGTGQLTVTQQMIDRIRSRVEALGYDAPTAAIEYITDNNYETFKQQKSVVKGTAERSDRKLTMSGWQNVIVYEVRDGGPDGTLIHVSDGMLRPSTTASFDVPAAWLPSWKVYAVQYDNRRIEVTF